MPIDKLLLTSVFILFGSVGMKTISGETINMHDEQAVKRELLAQFGEDLKIFSVKFTSSSGDAIEIVEEPYFEYEKLCRFRVVKAQKAVEGNWLMNPDSLEHRVQFLNTPGQCNPDESVLESSPITPAQVSRIFDYFKDADKAFKKILPLVQPADVSRVKNIVLKGKIHTVGLARDEISKTAVFAETRIDLYEHGLDSVVVFLSEDLEGNYHPARIEVINK